MAVEERRPTRHLIAVLVIGTATALGLGLTLRMPTQLEANDISRWCTVWSLLERGTYAIDECPWQTETGRTGMRIRRGTEFYRTRAEHFAPRFQLHVHFEANGGNVIHCRF